ncbi:DUF1223 domain-containing protein [Tropicimonas sp. S265A]|uniref:DUF1223 domain-containing protein n=1 Tax=Tropicimonas sp. S265A TaxID=3415134 RepID=UPI003C7990E5
MRKFFVSLALVLASTFGSTATATAADKLVVLELYTSQGCSSCPPADALLHKIDAEYEDVIALAFHVDYWDYIGWKDVFADPAFSKRQKDYGRAAGHRSVFTPQMVIGGLDHVVGLKPMDVANVIQAHRAVQDKVQISARRAGQDVVITLVPKGSEGEYRVLLIGYTAAETVAIKRGENAGKTITYANTVREMTDLGKWNGASAKSIRHRWPEGDKAAVLVQEAGMGPVVGAARAR